MLSCWQIYNHARQSFVNPNLFDKFHDRNAAVLATAAITTRNFCSYTTCKELSDVTADSTKCMRTINLSLQAKHTWGAELHTLQRSTDLNRH